jgi:hypothetical protein
MATHAYRCIQECCANQQNEEPETGVVVAAKGIGSLELADRGIQPNRMVCEGAALVWL